jgi:hypothetical protein
MTSLALETEPIASGVSFDADRMIVALADGRSLSIPLEWYPRLNNGTAAERGHWELLGQGEAIEWPDLDEHIGVSSLVAGRRSGESVASLNRWLSGLKRRYAL